MGRSCLLIFVFATAFAFAQAPAPKAPAKPKLAELITSVVDSVYVTGVWRPDNPTKKNELTEAVVELTCFRHGGEELVRSEGFCLQAMATSVNGMLVPSTQWLKVLEWSNTQIIASDDSSICVEAQTIFDLKRKTAIALDVRKPEAKGLNNACDLLPDRQTYYLQDVVDYYAQRQVNGTAPSATGASGTGDVCVESYPEDAEVFVDGQPVGQAPSALKLPAGDYLIEAKLNGHENWQQRIHVLTGSKLVLKAYWEHSIFYPRSCVQR